MMTDWDEWAEEVEKGPQLARCTRCGKAIWWVLTVNAKNMPLDPEPHLYIPRGFIVNEGVAEHRTRGQAIAEGVPLYRSHLSHCAPDQGAA